MTPIFDRGGRVVAWLESNEIYDLNGAHIAHMDDDGVFTGSGRKGSFGDGFFRDSRGNAIAFLEGATNGPLTPITQIPPIPPIPVIPPIPPIPSIAPIPPIPSFSWSDKDWQTFLRS